MSVKPKTELILSIIIVGFGLRLYQITLNDIWIDEAYSYFLSLQPVPQIIQGTMTDQHPPLYYLLLHYWLLIGHELFILRLLSAMIGTLSIALIYTVGKQMVNPVVGLISAFLLATSPIHIWYSQETRMYVLLVLLTMLSSYLCWRILRISSPKPRLWVGLVMVNLMAVYTHNMAVFILAFQNLIWLIGLLSRRSIPIRSWIIAQLVIGFGYLFWIPILYLQATQHPMPWINPPSLEAAKHIFYNLTFGEGWNADTQHYLGLIMVSLMFISALAGMFKTKSYFTIGYILAWTIAPATLITLVSFQVSLYQKKQFLIIVPPLMLILAVGTSHFKRLQLVWLIMLLGLIWTPLQTQYTVPTKTNWSQIARYIDDRVQPGDVIYLSAASSSLALNYYLKTGIPQTGYPKPFTFERGGWDGQIATPKIIDNELDIISSTYKRIWFLDYGGTLWDPQSLIPMWLDNHTQLIDRLRVHPVTVTLYRTND